MFVVVFLLTVGLGMSAARHKAAVPPSTPATSAPASTPNAPSGNGNASSHDGTTLTDHLIREKHRQLDTMMKADTKAAVDESHRARDNLSAEHPAPPAPDADAKPATAEVPAEDRAADPPPPEPTAMDQMKALRCTGNNAAVGGCVH